jgi:hypothetical protein
MVTGLPEAVPEIVTVIGPDPPRQIIPVPSAASDRTEPESIVAE